LRGFEKNILSTILFAGPYQEKSALNNAPANVQLSCKVSSQLLSRGYFVPV
jgi:hypothetical protein